MLQREYSDWKKREWDVFSVSLRLSSLHLQMYKYRRLLKDASYGKRGFYQERIDYSKSNSKPTQQEIDIKELETDQPSHRVELYP